MSGVLLAMVALAPLELLPPDASTLTLSGDTRRAITATTTYRIPFVPRALLTFAMGRTPGAADAPSLEVSVASGGNRLARFGVPSGRVQSWAEASLRLPPGTAEVTFEIAGAMGAVAEPVLHDLEAYGAARGVVLVSIDTLRRDHVGAYGYPRPTTPRLDGLAAASIVCDDAVSTSSWTLPAHLSMLTGVDPGRHGGVHRDHGFNSRVPTLPALLRAAGYGTHAVTTHLYVSAAYGLDDGFDSFFFRQQLRAPHVERLARSLLERFGDRPFFLFLHFYDPHAPYAPPARHLRLFERPGSYTGGISGEGPEFAKRPAAQVTRADVEHLKALYDGEVRAVDEAVGSVLDHMRELGLDRSTLVLVTSDHGEEFLEHGQWEHQRSLYEEVLRIPLLVRAPGSTPRREPRQATLLDVAPTVLAWLGLPVPSLMQGRSLLEPLPQRLAYAETDHANDGTRKVAVREGAASRKLVLSLDPKRTEAPVSGPPAASAVLGAEQFDLANDPAERRPAAATSDLHRAALERWAVGRRLPPGPRVKLTPEQVERLRALGYIGP